jgi:hypothetical protein
MNYGREQQQRFTDTTMYLCLCDCVYMYVCMCNTLGIKVVSYIESNNSKKSSE